MLTIVHNLNTRTEVSYELPPREAVRNAFAQMERKDWNTWDYAKYDSLVYEGKYTVACGDWAALK